MSSRFFSWINEIKIRLEERSPQIITDKEQFRLILKSEGFCGIYDGLPHYVNVESVGDCEVLFSEDNTSWSSNVPFLVNSGFKKVYVKASRNKRVEQCIVNIEVSKRNVVLISDDAEKEYDGNEVTNPTIRILGDGFVELDNVTVSACGRQIVPGTCINGIKMEFPESCHLDNYDIHIKEGILRVIGRREKSVITLETMDYAQIYTGKEVSYEEKISYVFDENGHTYQISGGFLRVCGKNAGVCAGEIVGEPKVYDEWNNDVTDQFTIVFKPFKLQINKRNVILKSGSVKKEYDGIELRNSDIFFSGEGFVDGEGIFAQTITSITTVGQIQNEIEYSFLNGTNPGNYLINIVPGMLTVIPRSEKIGIILRGNSMTCIYDGEEKAIHGLEQNSFEYLGNIFSVSGIEMCAKGKDVGTYCAEIEEGIVVYDSESRDVSDQFDISIHPGQLRINPREVFIESVSVQAEYSGDILSDSHINIIGDGFLAKDNISVSVVGQQTAPGKSLNLLKIVFPKGINQKNYIVHKSEGTLTVTDRIEKPIIELKPVDKEYIYTGEEYVYEESVVYTYCDNNHSYRIENAVLYARGINVGEYPVELVGTLKVYDEWGNEVSKQFEIQIMPAKLIVAKRKIVIKSGSTEKEYDGIELRNEHIYVEGDGFCNKDMPDIQVLGRQKLVGESQNIFTYNWHTSSLSQNYEITEEFGLLKVVNRQEKYKVDIHIPCEVFLYDSTEHTLSAPRMREWVIGETIYNVVIEDSGVCACNAGIYPYVFEGSYIVFDEDRNDVTDQFVVSIYGEVMEIQKRQISITPIQACKDYDGKPLSSSDVLIAGDGFAINEGIELFSNSSLLLPGQCENLIDYSFNAGTNPDNYIISVRSGELIIFDKKPKYNIQIIGESIEVLYDETEKELPEFSNLDFVLNDCQFHIHGISNKVNAIEEGVYQADINAMLQVYDDYGNDVTSQFEIEVQYGTLTILHNSEYDVPDIVDATEDAIDEYDITIQEILNEMSGTIVPEQKVNKYTRKELESLYVDQVQLLGGDGVIDSNYEFMLRAQDEIDEFSVLRNRIVHDFKEADLLCQIEINDFEFIQLKNYFGCWYFNNKRNGKHSRVDILVSVFLVQIGIRYYENNFWPLVAAMLGFKEIDSANRPWVGGTVTRTLLAFGKSVFSENEYVTNILMHSFVTDSFARRFFEYIFQYYSIDMERNLTGMQEMDISYLCNSIINPYAKRKQLLSNYTAMSIRGAYDYCKDVITNTLHMIDCNFWDEEYDEHVLTGRLATRFEEWKNQSDFYQTEKRKNNTNSNRNSNRNRMFRTPNLRCDIDTGRFAIILPPQLVHVADENELPDVKWFVVTRERREFSCELSEGYSGYKTNNITYFPEPDQIFEKHVFLLFVNREMVRSFTWDKRKINFFMPNGIWIKGERLEPGLTYAFGRDDSEIISKALMYVSRKNGLKFYELDIQKEDFVCVPDENNYYVGGIPKSGLTTKGILKNVFALHTDDEKELYSVYNEAPILVIDVEQEQYQGIAVIINKQVHKLSAINYTDVCLGRTSERTYYFIDMQELAGFQTGWNKVVIDYPKKLKHYVYEFYYYPALHYEFVGAPYIFSNVGMLRVQKESSSRLVKEECTSSVEIIQEQQFSMLDLVDGYIFQKLDDNCVLRIAVPMLRYSWDDIQWNHCRVEELWYADLQDVLYLEYPDNNISLSVAGGNESISMISYRKQQSGKIVCDLTKLKSYFNSEKITETINFIAGEIKIPLIKILQKSYLFSVRPTCDYEMDMIRVYFDLIGKNTYYAELYCEDELVSERVELDDQTAEFNCHIETANYIVKVYESEDEFGFDDDYDFVGEKEFSLINPLELIGGCMKIISINYEDRVFEAREEYEYYLFIDEQISAFTYKGILSGVFHKEYVMYASKVIITIPELNEISKVQVTRLSYSEEAGQFLLDMYNKAIIENRRKAKDKNYYILSEKDTWKVEYISSNSRRKKESIEWMEKSENARKRANAIWKND